MEIVRKEVDVYVCSDGFETMEKWRAESHQKSIDSNKKKEENLKNINKVEIVGDVHFIRFNKDMDAKITKETMDEWRKKEYGLEYAECPIWDGVKKDKWYMIEVEYKKEHDGDDCSLVVELACEEYVINKCKKYLDFLGQEEQMKLF